MHKKKWQSYKLFLFIAPFLALLFLFSYLPLYGWVYAFFDYHPPIPLSQSAFVGLHWFSFIFQDQTQWQQLWQVLLNTFAMSGLQIFTSWIPMIFAILLAEVWSSRFRKAVQILTTFPNFLSWVLVYAIAFSLFSSAGMVNTLLQNLGLIQAPIQFLQSDNHTWLTMWLWQEWKGLGWAAILYLAAMTGIDPELYEAARVDGAGQFRLTWNITIPSLLPTFFVLLLLNMANFLNNGMDQYYVFQNAFNSTHIQVLDLYVYNLGMGAGNYSMATALSMFKSVISVALLFSVNRISKILRGEYII